MAKINKPRVVKDYDNYLVRMTLEEANNIIENDDDFNDDGILRDDFALQEFEGHDDVDEDVNDIPDDMPEDEDEDDDDDI
jgi:hypothetical protein